MKQAGRSKEPQKKALSVSAATPKTERPGVTPNIRTATLTINQAHEIIGAGNITRQSLYLAAARGELPSIRLGKRILIPRIAFESWLSGAKPASGAA